MVVSMAPLQAEVGCAGVEDVSRRGLLTGIVAAAVLTACGGAGDGGDAPAAESTTRAVNHAMGSAEVPVRPQRVVTLWRPTMAAAIQLGFDPVGAVGEAGTPMSGLAAFLPDGYSVEKIGFVGAQGGFDVEKIAALKPDLIVGALTATGPERDRYPMLTQIAPTVLFTWAGTTSWRQHVRDVAGALGVPEKADAIVADYNARVGAVRAAVGGGAANVMVSLVRVQGPGVMRLETPLSFPGQVFADIGFGRPEAQRAPENKDADYIQISLERTRDADGDLIFVMFNAGNEEAWRQIQANPLWQGLGAQRAGKVFTAEYEWWGASNYYGAHRILEDVRKALG
ncbi:MAG: iron-siderophore ABC transporter substrate-binding protein [Dehalococcoidia bacterium]